MNNFNVILAIFNFIVIIGLLVVIFLAVFSIPTFIRGFRIYRIGAKFSLKYRGRIWSFNKTNSPYKKNILTGKVGGVNIVLYDHYRFMSNLPVPYPGLGHITHRETIIEVNKEKRHVGRKLRGFASIGEIEKTLDDLK